MRLLASVLLLVGMFLVFAVVGAIPDSCTDSDSGVDANLTPGDVVYNYSNGTFLNGTDDCHYSGLLGERSCDLATTEDYINVEFVNCSATYDSTYICKQTSAGGYCWANTTTVTVEETANVTETDCRDGTDNDGDGMIDYYGGMDEDIDGDIEYFAGCVKRGFPLVGKRRFVEYGGFDITCPKKTKYMCREILTKKFTKCLLAWAYIEPDNDCVLIGTGNVTKGNVTSGNLSGNVTRGNRSRSSPATYSPVEPEICDDYIDNDQDITIDSTGGIDTDLDISDIEFVSGCATKRNLLKFWKKPEFRTYGDSDTPCIGKTKYMCQNVVTGKFKRCPEGTYMPFDPECIEESGTESSIGDGFGSSVTETVPEGETNQFTQLG